MKLWQKIFLGSFITSAVILFVCGFVIVVTGLRFTLEAEMDRTQYYQSVYAEKMKEYLAAENGEADVFSYLDRFKEELAGEGRYLQIRADEVLKYDTFQQFPPTPRYTFVEGQAAYTPTYMKDIGDSRFLYVESDFAYGNIMYRVVMIKDLSEVYTSCNMQLNIFFSLCLLQAFIAATIMFLITKGITEPIERLNDAAKLMAQDFVPVQLIVDGEDEISELSNNFNIMVTAINKNIDSYKQIIGNMTHEIKTPLTSIIGYAELLKNNQCDAQMQEQALNYILEEGRRLNSLTRKMINLSRIQPGLLNMERNIVDKILDTSLMAVNIKSRQKDIRFTIDAGNDIYCYGDRELLITMLENILDNAIKASHQDGMISVKVNDQDGALAEIIVTDYGVGIPEENLNKIEQPFYKGDGSRSQEDSFGMGLAICKTVMQHHQGSIIFESSVGEYTRVTIKFPFQHYTKLEQSHSLERAVHEDSWIYEAFKIMN